MSFRIASLVTSTNKGLDALNRWKIHGLGGLVAALGRDVTHPLRNVQDDLA